MKLTAWLIAIGVSEILGFCLIYRIYRSDDYMFFKIAFTLLALIPFIGPFFVLWAAKIPTVQPVELQDRSKYTADVFDRWRHLIEQRDAIENEEVNRSEK